jgi:hypothetical protein
MRRPEVNLDAIAAALDKALDHPVTRVAEDYFPDTVRRMRQVRENLPEIASGVERKAVAALQDEAKKMARDLERECEVVGRGLGRFIDEALGKPKKKRAPAARRLKKGSRR